MTELQELIVRYLDLELTPLNQRTIADNDEYSDVASKLRKNFVKAIAEEYAGEIAEVEKALSTNKLDKYYGMLEGDALLPPNLPNTVTDQFLNEVALPKLYTATTTVIGALEVLSLETTRVTALESNITNLFYTIFGGDKKWRLDGGLVAMMPRCIYHYKTEVEGLQSIYANRKSQLEKAFSIISRIITMRTDTKANPTYRLGPLDITTK